MGLRLTYKEINLILSKLEKEYLILAKKSPDTVREGMYGVYAIKKVRSEILKYIESRND